METKTWGGWGHEEGLTPRDVSIQTASPHRLPGGAAQTGQGGRGVPCRGITGVLVGVEGIEMEKSGWVGSTFRRWDWKHSASPGCLWGGSGGAPAFSTKGVSTEGRALGVRVPGGERAGKGGPVCGAGRADGASAWDLQGLSRYEPVHGDKQRVVGLQDWNLEKRLGPEMEPTGGRGCGRDFGGTGLERRGCGAGTWSRPLCRDCRRRTRAQGKLGESAGEWGGGRLLGSRGKSISRRKRRTTRAHSF